LLALLLSVACSMGLSKQEAALVEQGAVIRSYSERPPFAGVIATFVKLSAATKGGSSSSEFFIVYLRDFEFPPRGAVCDIKYSVGNIDGLIGRTAGKIDNARLVEEITCGPQRFDFTK
jgi:hypothetical protein